MESINISYLVELLDKIKKLSNPEGLDIQICDDSICTYRVVYHSNNSIYCAVGHFKHVKEVADFIDDIINGESDKIKE